MTRRRRASRSLTLRVGEAIDFQASGAASAPRFSASTATTGGLTPPRSPLPRGFTLLEMVLALGLSSLLLVALYTALQMHWSSSALGQVEMERSQVARALFRRIETDLRSVVFRDSPLQSSTDDGSSASSGDTSSSSSTTGSTSGSSGSSSGGTTGSSDTSSSTSSSGSTGSSSSTTTTDTYSTQKTGVFGDSQNLVVHLSLPSRASTLSAAAQSTANGSVSGTSAFSGSDLQSVMYFLAGSSSSVAQQLSSSLTSATGQATGLARLQGDRMAMQAADESGDMSSMASGAQLLAPEVASIQFEYFDGVSWGTSWDSATSNSLPNAVRITIDFHPPVVTNGWYSRPVSASTDRFQHTVALPLAQPYVPSDSL